MIRRAYKYFPYVRLIIPYDNLKHDASLCITAKNRYQYIRFKLPLLFAILNIAYCYCVVKSFRELFYTYHNITSDYPSRPVKDLRETSSRRKLKVSFKHALNIL